MNTTKIGFIGAGNMAGSLIRGLCAAGHEPASIMAANTHPPRLNALAADCGITPATNDEIAAQAEVVVLAVKPQVMEAVCRELAPALPQKPPLLVSVAAGVRISHLQQWLLGDEVKDDRNPGSPRVKAVATETEAQSEKGDDPNLAPLLVEAAESDAETDADTQDKREDAPLPIVRCMPNTPALVGKGASGLFANSAVSQEQRQMAEIIFNTVGVTVWLNSEDDIDAVTALSGSGPAYFFLFMEAMQEAAMKLGLDEAVARTLTCQTAVGAAALAAAPTSTGDAPSARQPSATNSDAPSAQQTSATNGDTPSKRQTSATNGDTPSARQPPHTNGDTPSARQPSATDDAQPHPPASLPELRRQVTSPGGTTEQAVNTFIQGGLKPLVEQAMQAAYNRSLSLSNETDNPH